MACAKDALSFLQLPMFTYDNYIYLKPWFNEPLDNYNYIIRHIAKIEFCRVDNDYFNFYQGLPVKYEHPIVLTKNIKVLFLPDNYNQNVTLSKNTICLEIRTNFTKHITLPKKFKSLKLGYTYNNHLTLGKYIKYLHMGSSYNSVMFTTKNMRHLYIGEKYNCPIVLPKNLFHLEIYIISIFNLKMILPKKLKIFIPNYMFGSSLNLIEHPIEKIHVPNNNSFFRVYDNLPNGPTDYIIKISSGKNLFFNMPSKPKYIFSNQETQDYFCSRMYNHDHDFECKYI